MPWTKINYPDSMKQLSVSVRTKAIEIANAILKENKKMKEGLIVATAIKNAKALALKSEKKSPVAKVVVSTQSKTHAKQVAKVVVKKQTKTPSKPVAKVLVKKQTKTPSKPVAKVVGKKQTQTPSKPVAKVAIKKQTKAKAKPVANVVVKKQTKTPAKPVANVVVKKQTKTPAKPIAKAAVKKQSKTPAKPVANVVGKKLTQTPLWPEANSKTKKNTITQGWPETFADDKSKTNKTAPAKASIKQSTEVTPELITHGEDMHFIPVKGDMPPATKFEVNQAENIFHHREEVAMHQENQKITAAMATRKNAKRIYRNNGRR